MSGLPSLWGIGHLRPAPGTWGSLAALVPGAALLALGGPALVAAAAVVLAALGWRAVASLPPEVQANDAGWIVVDEAAGQWLALAGLATVSLTGVAAALLLFRAFDILKPWPVSWADRRKDALGIMLDDLVAGALAGAIILGLRHLVPEGLP